MITTFNGIENAGDAREDGAEDCEHESYTWTADSAYCDACGVELTRTRLDPRYLAQQDIDGTIPPPVRLAAWAGEIELGGWTGSVNPDGIEAFASAVEDDLDGLASPDSIVIRAVERGKPGRIVYRDGMVVR